MDTVATTTAPTEVTVTLPVEGSPTATDCRNVSFHVTKVEWRAYVYQGEFWFLGRAHGAEPDGARSNCAVYLEDLPEWAPAPPAWFDEVAEQVRAGVESTA